MLTATESKNRFAFVSYTKVSSTLFPKNAVVEFGNDGDVAI